MSKILDTHMAACQSWLPQNGRIDVVDGDLFHLDDETVLMSPTVDGQGPITDAELDEGGVPLKHDAFDLLA